MAKITLHRHYGGNKENEIFDAFISYLMEQSSVKEITFTSSGVAFISDYDEITLKDGLCAKLESYTTDNSGDLEKITMTVFSEVHEVSYLVKFLEDVREEYIINQKNKMGRTLYAFEQITQPLPERMDMATATCLQKMYALDTITSDIMNKSMKVEYEMANPNMVFTMTPFNTNKSLSNLFGSSVEQAKRRIDFFRRNPEWYAEKGVPYSLGMLLHGSPGCGKTSFLKAVARDLDRHVVILKLDKHTTVTQLRNFFFQETIRVGECPNQKTYIIPVNRRLIVLEDIDCIPSVVSDRSTGGTGSDESEESPEKLSLGVILNLLDGIVEMPGRMIVMTTNHPELLDPALIRPGRIDCKIHFDHCSPSERDAIYRFFCSDRLDAPHTLPDFVMDTGKNYTTAEVFQMCVDHVE